MSADPNNAEKLKITKIKGRVSEQREDFVVQEVPLTIMANGTELVTLLCSPIDIENLVSGFLFTSGLIFKISDLKTIRVDKKRWTVYVDLIEDSLIKERTFKRVYTSGCGRGTLFYDANDFIRRGKVESDLKIPRDYIYATMKQFQKMSDLYRQTGGVHSSAVADMRAILVFRDDIGRHNTIDKVIGYCVARNLPVDDKILLTSGRISSEVLLKAQKIGFPIVISKSAPTNQAVNLARDMEITLIGFVRGQSMNIYSEPERILY